MASRITGTGQTDGPVREAPRTVHIVRIAVCLEERLRPDLRFSSDQSLWQHFRDTFIDAVRFDAVTPLYDRVLEAAGDAEVIFEFRTDTVEHYDADENDLRFFAKRLEEALSQPPRLHVDVDLTTQKKKR